MRTRKIISLLFTLAQLIFFIKLIEYAVQGADSVPTPDMSIDKGNLKSLNVTDKSTGRACPACTGGDCDANVGYTTFPFFQLKVGAAVMAIWYFIFLYVWKYPIVPQKQSGTQSAGGYPNSVGYNYGPQSSYGQKDGNFGSSVYPYIGGLFDSVVQALDKLSP